MKVDIISLKEDIGKLKSQIVESPEELKSQMEKMKDNVKNIKNSIVSRTRMSPEAVVLGFFTRMLISLFISDRNKQMNA